MQEAKGRMGIMKLFVLVGWIAALVKTQSYQSGDTAFPLFMCRGRVDIVFVLDSSTSITVQNFRKMLTIAATVTSVMKVEPDNVRIGLVEFADEANVVLNLTSYYDLQTIRSEILGAEYLEGSTYLDKGLSAAHEMLRSVEGQRSDSTGVIIVMTDGRSSNPVKTHYVADQIYKSNIKVLAVGFGDSVIDSELLILTKDCANIFKDATFDNQHSSLSKLVIRTCQVGNGIQVPVDLSSTEKNVCKVEADIVFVIDSSASIGWTDYQKVLQFAANVTSQFTVGPTDVMFAEIIFGYGVREIFGWSDSLNKSEVISALLSTPYLNENTATDKALKHVEKMIATYPRRRPNAKTIVLLITDGVSDNREEAYKAASRLKDAGVIISVVGIGELDETELSRMASSTENVFIVEVFDELPKLIYNFANSACNAP